MSSGVFDKQLERRYGLFIPVQARMATSVKKTISLPAELARDAEALAKAEGKTLSAVIQDALRQTRIERRRRELHGMQGYWSRKARDRGILTEQDIERHLRR
jgi:predicted transcriptional regulator